MVVGEGTVNFEAIRFYGERDETELNRNSSMRDLMRGALYYMNENKRIADFILNKLLFTDGRNRVLESKFSGEEDFFAEYNPFDDWEKDFNARQEFVGSLENDSKLMPIIMRLISYYTYTIGRKWLVSYFMSKGLHIKCRNTFRLLTDIQPNDEIDDDTAEQMSKENEEINEIIESFIEDYDTRSKDIYEDFYEKAKSYSIDEKAMVDYLNKNIDRIATFEDYRKNNLNRDLEKLKVSDEDSKNSGEYVVNRKKIGALRIAVNDFRKNMKDLFAVPQFKTQKELGLNSSIRKGTTKEKAISSLAWLLEQIGSIDL